jgi:hypothetical protein
VTHDDVWKFVNMAEGMTEDTRESERKFLFWFILLFEEI